jgi:hypothetical protein
MAEKEVKEKEEVKEGNELLKELVDYYGEEVKDVYMKYKDKDIYVYIFNDDSLYLFLPMKNKEYREIQKKAYETALSENIPKEEIEKDLIVQKFTIYPELNAEALEDMPAGKFETLYDLIMKASHFNTQNPVLAL